MLRDEWVSLQRSWQCQCRRPSKAHCPRKFSSFSLEFCSAVPFGLLERRVAVAFHPRGPLGHNEHVFFTLMDYTRTLRLIVWSSSSQFSRLPELHLFFEFGGVWRPPPCEPFESVRLPIALGDKLGGVESARRPATGDPADEPNSKSSSQFSSSVAIRWSVSQILKIHRSRSAIPEPGRQNAP